MNLHDDPILTVRQVADYLQLSKSKVYYMIQRRKIPYIRLGKNVRIRKSDLERWIESHLEVSL